MKTWPILNEHERRLLDHGGLIDAIKRYRDRATLELVPGLKVKPGLRICKQIVDAYKQFGAPIADLAVVIEWKDCVPLDINVYCGKLKTQYPST